MRRAALALIIIALFAASPATAGLRERKLEIVQALILEWPAKYRGQAYTVAGCETGGTFDTHARNGDYLGLWQQGSWQRQKFGFGWTAIAQARSAWRAFKDNGLCWVCNDQWPTCGRQV